MGGEIWRFSNQIDDLDMRFTVEKDGVVKMHTEEKCCIPDKEILQAMKKAGYKIKMDGKAYRCGEESV